MRNRQWFGEIGKNRLYQKMFKKSFLATTVHDLRGRYYIVLSPFVINWTGYNDITWKNDNWII